MNKLRRLLAGYKRLGIVNRCLFWFAILAILITIGFGIWQLRTGATKEGQKTARLDRDIKHKDVVERISNIDSKIEMKNRPYIGVEKFAVAREDNKLTPLDYVTIHLKNYGGIPANDVIIYLDIFDEIALKKNIEKFPFRYKVAGNFAIMPQDKFGIENASINTSVILDENKYDKWYEEEVSVMNERLQYYRKNKRFPNREILYVVLEIKYRGIEKVKELPFSLRAVYTPEVKGVDIAWTSKKLEIK